MRNLKIQPTGREVSFGENDIIVSKTDPQGRILYANDVFLKIAGYTEAEVIGQPHSLIRHPSMPRCVFYLLWETIKGGNEIFAYVLNMAKNGDGYWVFAHVTPSYTVKGSLAGYHSNRRVPNSDALEKVRPLYAQLLKEEQRHSTANEGMRASYQMLLDLLNNQGVTYGEFVFSLSCNTQLEHSIQ